MIEFVILLSCIIFVIGILFYPPLGAPVVKHLTSPAKLALVMVKIAGSTVSVIAIYFISHEWFFALIV